MKTTIISTDQQYQENVVKLAQDALPLRKTFQEMPEWPQLKGLISQMFQAGMSAVAAADIIKSAIH